MFKSAENVSRVTLCLTKLHQFKAKGCEKLVTPRDQLIETAWYRAKAQHKR